MIAAAETLPRPGMRALGNGALAVCVAAAALCAFGCIESARQFLQSYLFAYVFWIEPALGCLGLLMLYYLVGGAWGGAVRRFMQAGSLTLPWMALLFLPVAVGLRELYPWALPHVDDPQLLHKHAYLNAPFYWVRAAAYFCVWGGLAAVLGRNARAEARGLRENDSGAVLIARMRLRAVAAPGLILFSLAANFAAVDWTMSLEPHWYSTMYGFLFIAQQAPAALCLLILSALSLRRAGPDHEIAGGALNDLGSLLLTFLILWIYASFFQYVLIWFGNLPGEISWYLRRESGGWKWIARFFTVFYFAVPFGFLLFRSNRSSPRALARLGLFLLAVHTVYIYWFIAPSFHPYDARPHWLDAAAWLALGGFWLRLYLALLRRLPEPGYARKEAAGV